MKKITLSIIVSILSQSAFGAKAIKINWSHMVSKAFEKPALTTISDIPTKTFEIKAFQALKTPEEKQSYLSFFLKLNQINIIENDKNVLLVHARNAPKMEIPVFKDIVPQGTREQMVTVVKPLPKKLRRSKASSIEKTLRALYGMNGDLKIDSDKKTLLITDWVSNQRRLNQVLKAM